MKVLSFVKVLGILVIVGALAACNTVEGVGKDISKAGDAISGTASDAKQ